MNIVLRYACLLGLGLASLLAFISAGSVTGQLVMAGSDSSVINSQDMSLWVLGLIVIISLWSVFRFMFGQFPMMIRDWYHGHKEKMATLAMAGVVCFVFVVF